MRLKVDMVSIFDVAEQEKQATNYCWNRNARMQNQKRFTRNCTIRSSSGVIYPFLSTSNLSKAAFVSERHFPLSCSTNWCTCKVAATNSSKSINPSVLLSICSRRIVSTLIIPIPKEEKSCWYPDTRRQSLEQKQAYNKIDRNISRKSCKKGWIPSGIGFFPI